jgi:DNA-binding XRE family transcriptional regulator
VRAWLTCPTAGTQCDPSLPLAFAIAKVFQTKIEGVFSPDK